jgi:hypothetical protein
VSAPLFVFCADLHLADGAWTSRPGIYGDSYYSLMQIVDYCLAHSLPLVIGGDVLDVKKNSARPVQHLCAQMSRMAAANLPVYYIQGQHELDRYVTWLSVHPWPTNVNKTQFTIAGVKLYGIDWLPRGDIQEAFKEVPPDTDVLVCHQVWKDFMKNVGRPECHISDVHHVKYILSGDFHVTTIETSANAHGELAQLISAGSTCMQDISECPEKYFYVVTQEAGKFVPSLQQLKTRRMRAYTVTDPATLDDLCAGGFLRDIQEMLGDLPAEINKPLIRVKFDKRIPDAYIRITTAINDSAHLFCDALVDKTRGEQETNRSVTKNDLMTALTELLHNDPVAFNLASVLLAAESPSGELEQQFVQFQNPEVPKDAVTAS